MGLIDDIMAQPELADNPPVLVDIGAAGRLNPRWRRMARYCIAVAFDPDSREMGYAAGVSGRYRRLHVIPKIVTDRSVAELDFYLTRRAQTSSSLPPTPESVGRFLFADYFDVLEKKTLAATTLSAVFDELQLPGVDWFKSDSQGLDWRLFASLGEARMKGTLVAEFEPGIVDGYEGEDMLVDVMRAMAPLGFLMTELHPRGPQRLGPHTADRYFTGVWRLLLEGLAPKCPGWAGATYINELAQPERFTRRSALLGWTFATVLGQHGLALELADRGREQFDDGVFSRMTRHSVSRLRRRFWRLAPWLARRLARRLLRPTQSG